jgi:alpha-glucosidase
MMRPVFLEFPEIFAPNANFDHWDTEFLLGPSLLVAPAPFGEKPDDYVISYPPGTWFDFWTGEKTPEQPSAPALADAITAKPGTHFPEQHRTHPKLDTMPVYVRGGSVLPMQPLIQSTDDTPGGPLELRVYPGDHCSGSLYLDDGHTFAYKQGQYLRQTLSCTSDANSVRLKFHAREGSYAPWWKIIEVVVYDWPSAHAEAKVSGSAYPVKTTYDPKQHALHVTLADQAGETELSIRGRAAH